MSAADQNPTQPVLPASRQPVPMAPEVQAELAKRGRSARQIESDITARTERLAANIDELTARLSPSRLVKDGTAGLRARITTPDGNPRLDVLGAVAGAALVVGLLLWRARRR
ncbi:DUF3618 domain-containing protein [Jiangella aurantiaca]|uniref:DUF3618 domain-containing protein n=1 Tax=Jiangella aurantiaca TaxID=2530373 RepID=A0A4R4ZX03_9ACTN|nr:DUF3618 domain-containing protein [Jiangella aurantiaca]TDD63771.1 DUF3618 domain-containing protein [Jiangella aurantiaca]